MVSKDRVSMDKQSQIRYLYNQKYPIKRIAESLNLCRKTVRKYLEQTPSTQMEQSVDNQQVLLSHDVIKPTFRTCPITH